MFNLFNTGLTETDVIDIINKNKETNLFKYNIITEEDADNIHGLLKEIPFINNLDTKRLYFTSFDTNIIKYDCEDVIHIKKLYNIIMKMFTLILIESDRNKEFNVNLYIDRKNETVVVGKISIEQLFKDLFNITRNEEVYNWDITYSDIGFRFDELKHKQNHLVYDITRMDIGKDINYDDVRKNLEETINLREKIMKNLKEFYNRFYKLFIQPEDSSYVDNIVLHIDNTDIIYMIKNDFKTKGMKYTEMLINVIEEHSDNRGNNIEDPNHCY